MMEYKTVKDPQRTQALEGLKSGGCYSPNMCVDFPYSCGCGFLVRAEFTTIECIRRLSQGLPIDTEKGG